MRPTRAPAESPELRRLIELEQKAAELREALLPELFLPVSLDSADGVSDGVGGPFAARGEGDPFRPSVIGVRSALQVAEAFELAEEVVDRLLAHASPGGELGGSRPLGPWVQQEVQVRPVQVVEPLLVQMGEHPSQHLLPRHPQEDTDQRRPEGSSAAGLSKVA